MYVTDLTHFLDGKGDIPVGMPREARELASFFALIVDSVTSVFPTTDGGVGTGIRCHSTGCQGKIIGTLDRRDGPVGWYCPACGDGGTIANWQGTRWDNTEP